MEAKFSQRVKDVISYSREEALRLGNDFIGVEHLLLGLIREGDGKAIVVLKEFQLNLKMIRKEIDVCVSESIYIKGFTHKSSHRLLATNARFQPVISINKFSQVAYFS